MRTVLLALLVCAAPALARERLEPVARPARWGFGFMLGEPFGLSLKRYLGGVNAFDVYASPADGPGIRFGGDWLWNLGRAEHGRQFDIDIYAGVGPTIGSFQGGWCGPGFYGSRCGNGNLYIGGRIPLGVEMLLREAPFSFGLEVAPGIAFAPDGFLLFDFLFAVRFLF